MNILIVACGIGFASMGPKFAFTVVLAFAGLVPIPFAAFANPNPYNWPWPPFLDVAARRWAAWSLDGNAAQVRKLLNRVGSGSG